MEQFLLQCYNIISNIDLLLRTLVLLIIEGTLGLNGRYVTLKVLAYWSNCISIRDAMIDRIREGKEQNMHTKQDINRYKELY